MDYKSEQKFILMTPKKLRLVRNAVSKIPSVEKMMQYLELIEKRAGEPLLKVIKTAVANAKQAGTDVKDLIVKEVVINEGPRIRRGRAGSRGRLKPYKRRMSHVRVVLTDQGEKTPNSKLQKDGAKTAEKEEPRKSNIETENKDEKKSVKTKVTKNKLTKKEK